MPHFLVTLSQSGPQFDRSKPVQEQSGWAEHAAFMDALVERGFIVIGGLLPDFRAAHAVEAASEAQVRETLAKDNWSGSHLVLERVEPWDVKLDGTRRG